MAMGLRLYVKAQQVIIMGCCLTCCAHEPDIWAKEGKCQDKKVLKHDCRFFVIPVSHFFFEKGKEISVI
jgi:hypothetical protein